MLQASKQLTTLTLEDTMPEPQDTLYVRRTRTTDGFYLSYTEHGENRDRIWHDFRSKNQLAGWATLQGYQIVFVD